MKKNDIYSGKIHTRYQFMDAAIFYLSSFYYRRRWYPDLEASENTSRDYSRPATSLIFTNSGIHVKNTSEVQL